MRKYQIYDENRVHHVIFEVFNFLIFVLHFSGQFVPPLKKNPGYAAANWVQWTEPANVLGDSFHTPHLDNIEVSEILVEVHLNLLVSMETIFEWEERKFVK